MQRESTRFIVVTGGPGSGKTTLLDALAQAGFARSEEAGRGIIRDQTAIGGRALPWVDRELFAESMLCWEMRSYRLAAEQPGTVWFDRGIPDIIGYLRVEGLPVSDHLRLAANRFRYHERVFIAPPWPEIYEQDVERKQSIEVAESTYWRMVETYTEFGYTLVTLPRVSLSERLRFVTEALA
ncbi:AAA family ATPase [Actinoalloteichus hymeniacidonis]|uniref:ATPase n=1 Tax=Actinoalloteichus hymeniacidonis TaxID=340345 RepID=A0AAC9HL56_9PSEU|nr:AAA family ATPase [Actinoalloteichus hymeniacidonis]AOS61392.1 putative ATPase [Actinoalloteichus hymeniacidonis]MBB5910603.1 putative ATPase [Actinoalloteichus hymeniacidonis]